MVSPITANYLINRNTLKFKSDMPPSPVASSETPPLLSKYWMKFAFDFQDGQRDEND